MEHENIVIVSAKRTPMGSLLGDLSSFSASELGAFAIKAVLDDSKIPPDHINEVIMGCVLPAGQGQAPARQAALRAGLPTHCGATTINKMCGSGLKAIMIAHDLLQSPDFNALIAGGMESMSNAPYLLPKARQGLRLGHADIKDHMFLDGLEDAYDKGQLMGAFAEATAEKFHITRELQDNFALSSLKRAKYAQETGLFADEITPITTHMKNESKTISQDEGPRTARPEKIPTLKPAFKKDGTVTAANSSSISDGASAVLLMRETDALAQGYKPLARIVAHASYAHEPAWFTTAPASAIKEVLKKSNWQLHDVDLFEINEAFAVVTLVTMQELQIDISKVNLHGGACALGHPIGASGARILTTLIYALKHSHLKRGVASLCIGGGEAVAMAIELI